MASAVPPRPAPVNRLPSSKPAQRWLEIRRVSGPVQVLRAHGAVSSAASPAQVGQRLQRVGEGIQTGANGTVVLSLDTAIGTIHVAEHTLLRIQQLQVTAKGGHATLLSVPKGQVRLSIRRFTNPDSRLELATPAGVSGVRGTEFGLVVAATGHTGVATRSGAVVSSAQGESVTVVAGQQTVLVPGEPPGLPQPLRDDASLDLQGVERRGAQLRIWGQTDGVNHLELEGQTVPLDRNGRFDWVSPGGVALDDRPIMAVVVTPLGRRQRYQLRG